MLDKMSDTSRIVDRLIRKGMVRKTPNAADRRLVDIIITSRGRKLLEKIDPLEDEMDKMMTSLSPEEASTLSRLLDKLRNVLPLLFLLFLTLPVISVAQQSDTTARPRMMPGLTNVPPDFIIRRPDSVRRPDTTTNLRPKYEFRAVWVASVGNIDWPSKKGLPVDSQKAEFTRLVDMHQRNGLNAVVVQIRPAANAFFPSPYEPWSEWLTGIQGQPPSPYYDPLAFMIEETHKRGMEFHAWCNPYRAVHTIGKSSVAPDHVTRQHPNGSSDSKKHSISTRVTKRSRIMSPISSGISFAVMTSTPFTSTTIFIPTTSSKAAPPARTSPITRAMPATGMACQRATGAAPTSTR